jgi:carbonic anhydrase
MVPFTSLDPWIGNGNTLVITCQECSHCFYGEHFERVFIYTCLGAVLQKDDLTQRSCLRDYVEELNCSQIVLIGHCNCTALHRILNKVFVPSKGLLEQYNVDALQRVHADKLFVPATKVRVLDELNVLEQVRLLMAFPFIRWRQETGRLNIVGLLLDDNGVHEIFRNGIPFNNLLISN